VNDMNTVNTFTNRRRAQLAGISSADSTYVGYGAIGPVPDWLAAESITSQALSPSGDRLAFVSDRDGLPALWITELGCITDMAAEPLRLDTGTEHVRAVSWSPDGRWLACLLAPFGGEQTSVLVLRPDGTDIRALTAGPGGAATLGAWRADGRLIGITESGRSAAQTGSAPDECQAYAVDPATGRRTLLATGPAAVVCTLSPNGRHAVVRVGRRGTRQLLLVGLNSGRRTALLIEPDATVADARFTADGSTLYLHTDSGLDRPALLGLDLNKAGLPRSVRPRLVAARPDADLDLFALSRGQIAMVWNVDGYSELELIDPTDGTCHARRTPAEVVTSCVFAQDGSWLLLGAESPTDPPHVVACPISDGRPRRLVSRRPDWPAGELVEPTLLRFAAEDGLELSGWWYGPKGVLGAGPTVLWLHGGPEAQERPTFAPLLQALATAGVAVFAPNVRGSSGFGHDFVNADNVERRFAAISDVAAAANFLISAGLADPARLGVSGRSYGGYLTLAALVHFPELFRVGVDVCGMADLETFFAYTEPWIATAATSKYGDPDRDRALLRELSPLHRIERLVAPLLVVHGGYDTNVPLVEAEQLVQALHERGAAPGFLLFPDEGHEVHGTANRARFIRAVVDWLTSHLLEIGEQTA
jgi:dipeptidyl aminopeptidase/acylaminoacyl peptidase